MQNCGKMESQNEILERLKHILECFLDKNFVTSNAVYFEKLITHLAAKENAFVLQAPFALDWVDRCITIMSEDIKNVNPKVISFTFNFFSLLTSNEWIVIKIRDRRLVDRILEIVKRDSHQFNPSMKLGIIRLLSAVSQYVLGLVYVRTTKAWQFLIEYCNQDHTLYVVREARCLLYELLYKFSVKTKDEDVVQEMLLEIYKPIMENVYNPGNESIMVNVDDTELLHKLSSTLDLMSYIFQQTLESEENTKIAQWSNTERSIGFAIWRLTDATHNESYLLKILTALTSFNFARLVSEKWSGQGQIASEDFSEFGVTFFNLMKFCVNRRNCLNFLKLAELNHVLWKKLGQRAPQVVQIENERVRFENQLITFQLLPVHFILRSREYLEEEFFEKHIMNVFEVICEHTMRISYSFRDLLFNFTSVMPTADLAYKSIYGILSLIDILERDQAILVFQAVIYALKEFVLTSTPAECFKGAVCSNDTRSSLIVEVPNVLYAILVSLQTLIERFKISWKESIETICLVNCVLSILEHPDLSARLVVQALKLLQLSIEHFLSPNMALLVDNLQGSGLVCMGPMIVKRFHDPAWEVRDSTLELVSSIVNISYMKYPAFQKFLTECRICPVVYDMAKSDGEPYVRASAFKCLSQMVTINMIWENDLCNLDLVEHLFFVLYNESEGIVRKEAMCTLTQIYEHRKIPAKYKDTLYATLAYSITADLHWEVKVNALHWWKLEIKKQLTNQGMIDGTFPTVTFSKENKKIVKLTPKEINLRISKVLNDMAQHGCLGVLLKCLNDDCDLGVIKAAMSLVQIVLQKLKQYGYEPLLECNETANDKINHNDILAHKLAKDNQKADLDTTNMFEIKTKNTIAVTEYKMHEQIHQDTLLSDSTKREAVIESILDAQDINLLAAAYEEKMQVNGECGDFKPLSTSTTNTKNSKIDPFYYRQFANISVHEFITTIKKTDYEQLLHEQHEWFLCAESLSSLLDDIIFVIKPECDAGSISADCY